MIKVQKKAQDIVRKCRTLVALFVAAGLLGSFVLPAAALQASELESEDGVVILEDELNDAEVTTAPSENANDMNPLSNPDEKADDPVEITDLDIEEDDLESVTDLDIEEDHPESVTDSDVEENNLESVAKPLQEQEQKKDTEGGEGKEAPTGFVKEKGRIFYYDENGNRIIGQKKIDGFWYMFLTPEMAKSSDEVGAMQTGFVHIPYQNKVVYYSEIGEIGSGLGRMQYGQKKIDGYWYNFKQGNGAMYTGFVTIASQNKIVYYSESGEIGNGLGRMQYGQKKIDGYWYNFKQGSGAMYTGFVTIASQGKIVYYRETGKVGSGLGQMQYGQKKIDGYWYNFKNGSGAMQMGFVDIPSQNKRVFYNNTGRVGEGLGQMQYGQRKIGNYWYMFRPGNGAMVTGFYRHSNMDNKQEGKTCYYNEQGQMQYGKVRIGGGIYVFHKSTGALTGPYANSEEIRPNQLIYYCQKDKAWDTRKFVRSTIGKAGCGLCSFSMIATLLKNEDLTPPVVAEVANRNPATMYTPMFPSVQAFDHLANYYGIRRPEIRRYYRGGGVSDISYLQKKLEQGCAMILNGHYGGRIFTSDHFLVLYGQGEKGPLVFDPGWEDRCNIDKGGVSWRDALSSVDYVLIFSPAPSIKVRS